MSGSRSDDLSRCPPLLSRGVNPGRQTFLEDTVPFDGPDPRQPVLDRLARLVPMEDRDLAIELACQLMTLTLQSYTNALKKDGYR